MSYNRPYGVEYCESEREVRERRPYYGGGYSAGYGVSEYGDGRIHQHQNGLGNVITEVSEVIPGSGHHHHHNHSRPVEYIEREERIVDSAYDPYRRIY